MKLQIYKHHYEILRDTVCQQAEISNDSPQNLEIAIKI